MKCADGFPACESFIHNIDLRAQCRQHTLSVIARLRRFLNSRDAVRSQSREEHGGFYLRAGDWHLIVNWLQTVASHNAEWCATISLCFHSRSHQAQRFSNSQHWPAAQRIITG